MRTIQKLCAVTLMLSLVLTPVLATELTGLVEVPLGDQLINGHRVSLIFSAEDYASATKNGCDDKSTITSGFGWSIDGVVMELSPSFLKEMAEFNERLPEIDSDLKSEQSLTLLHEVVSAENIAALEQIERLVPVDALRASLGSSRIRPDHSFTLCAIALISTAAIVLGVEACCAGTAGIACLACAAAGAISVAQAMEPCLSSGGPGGPGKPSPACPTGWSCPGNCPFNADCTCPAVLPGPDGNPICVQTP